MAVPLYRQIMCTKIWYQYGCTIIQANHVYKDRVSIWLYHYTGKSCVQRSCINMAVPLYRQIMCTKIVYQYGCTIIQANHVYKYRVSIWLLPLYRQIMCIKIVYQYGYTIIQANHVYKDRVSIWLYHYTGKSCV